MIFAQSVGGGDFLVAHMSEIKALVDQAGQLQWHQTWYGQLIIGLAIAIIFSAINHAWGYARGFEKGRRAQQADTEQIVRLISTAPDQKLLEPPSG